VSSLPLELQGQLPAPEQVARLLGGDLGDFIMRFDTEGANNLKC